MSEGDSPTNQNELQLAFINISDQSAIKDPIQQQRARTQAIKNSLQRKRHQLQLTNGNFVDENRNAAQRGKGRAATGQPGPIEPAISPAYLASSIVDPFGTHAVDRNRLSVLLQHISARQLGKPETSAKSPAEFERLRNVFHAELADPALASAVSLALAFAANGGVMDRECTAYRLKAIQHVNKKLSDPAQAPSTTVFGTIIMLVGVEARLGDRETAQMHLNGMRQLLLLANEYKTPLNHVIKRALFWQDLFSAVIAGTDRVFHHEMFPEIHWQRDPSDFGLHPVPIGFEQRRRILGEEFSEIVRDIRALQHLCDNGAGQASSDLHIEKIDNQQACIESRLEQLRHHATEPIVLCCIPAAFLCTYRLSNEVWTGHLVPSRVTASLLKELQGTETWPGWDTHEDLLLWVLNIGVAFATDASDQLGFANIWHGSHSTRLQSLSHSWFDVEEHLRDFIWSDTMYHPRCEEYRKRHQEQYRHASNVIKT